MPSDLFLLRRVNGSITASVSAVPLHTGHLRENGEGRASRLFPHSELKDLDYPDGPVVKNWPASAGDTGSIPVSGKIPHATRHLSPRAAITEAHAHESLGSTTKEATATRRPHTTRRE